MPTIQQTLETAFQAAIRKAFSIEADPLVTTSQNEQFGDYQSNAAMGLSKALLAQTGQKTNPRDVAEKIKANLRVEEIASEVSIAGPGFINVRLSPSWLSHQLTTVTSDARLGVTARRAPQTVVVDYSAVNIAKEMHVGHLRSTIIGDAFARVLSFSGDRVIRQNHIGDWGTQFGMLITHLKSLGSEGDADVSDLDAFYKAARKRFDSDPAFAEAARAAVVRLQAGNEEEIGYWRRIVKASRKHYQPIYDRLKVLLTPDDERGESFYNALLPSVVQDLRQLGIGVESDGAIVAFVKGYDAPLMIQKRDGGYGYGTTDLAAVRHRVGELHADRIIYVIGFPQSQHLTQVREVAARAGWLGDASFEHAAFGSVLGEDGKMFKARSGESVKLADLLDQAESRGYELAKSKAAERGSGLEDGQLRKIGTAIGIGAVKYADLSKDRTSDYVFSWDKMLAMDGNTAPYLQYAYARIRSIQRKSAAPPSAGGEIRLESPHELSLAKHILRLGEVIDLVSRDLKPHLLCTYLYDLATKFSGFYENCPVIQSEEPTRSSRLALCDLTARTLAVGLDLLGIEHPEQM